MLYSGDNIVNQQENADFKAAVEAIQQEIDRREKELYSETVRREASRPQNMGRMSGADYRGQVQGWCGDTMAIDLRLDGDTIGEATFVTDGCGVTLACGSMLTQMVTGMNLEEAEAVLPEDLLEALEGLPKDDEHCADLAVSTLHNALFDWRVSTMEQEEEAEGAE